MPQRLFSREDSDSSGSLADAESLARLINAAFRVEQPFIEGIALMPEGVRSYMAKGNSLSPETPQASQPASMSNSAATVATWAYLVWTLCVREPGSAAE